MSLFELIEEGNEGGIVELEVSEGENMVCVENVPLLVSKGGESFEYPGILMDGDFEELCSEYDVNLEYLDIKTESFSDIVKVTDEFGNILYVPIGQREDYETPDDYMIVGLSTNDLDFLKSNRSWKEEIALNQNTNYLRWRFLESKYPNLKSFGDYIAYEKTVNAEDFNSMFKDFIWNLTDEELDNKFNDYLKDISKYSEAMNSGYKIE